jgi:hypothetical protein
MAQQTRFRAKYLTSGEYIPSVVEQPEKELGLSLSVYGNGAEEIGFARLYLYQSMIDIQLRTDRSLLFLTGY